MSLLKKNSLFAFLGFIVPAFIMFIAYPILIRHIGVTRMGIYLLGTSVSGAMGFLDVGFSAATLKFISEDIAAGRLDDAAEVIVTSLAFYGALGILAGTMLYLTAPWLVHAFKVAPPLYSEGVASFRIAAVQFGVFLFLNVFLNLFKGFQQFQHSSLCVSLLSILTYGGAVIGVLLGGYKLVGVTSIGLLSNCGTLIVAGTIGMRICRRENVYLLWTKPSKRTFRRMLRFGSVITINSLSQLGLYQGQRFLVGVLIGPAAVTIYQLASMIPSKVYAAIATVSEVLFPTTSAANDLYALRRIYLKMLATSGLLASAALLPLGLLAPWILSLWLGPVTARSVTPYLPIFCLATFFVSLSCAPYYFCYGLGRPELNTAYNGCNAIVNLSVLGAFSLTGSLTISQFSWAFALGNVASVVAFHFVVERIVWRALLARQKSLQMAGRHA